MDFLHQDSFTPWETPNLQDKCINYLRKPQEIFLKSPQRHYNTVHEAPTQPKQSLHTHNQVFVSKQNKNYFIQRNKINSRCKPSRNASKALLKKSHQSLNFSRQTQKRSVNLTRQQQHSKQPFHTLTNFAVKRKSLKQKIQKTKKLLEKTQITRTSQIKDKPRQEKHFEESLQRLLSLSKSHHNLKTHMPLNPSMIDSFFQVNNMIRSHKRGKNSCTDLYINKEASKPQLKREKGVDFLQSKNNIAYIKKKGCNRTFYKQTKQQKMMSLPKIQIMDWQRPQI